MEGDVMDKLDDMASVYEFDPFTGNIPATKVEITVSCRLRQKILLDLALHVARFHPALSSSASLKLVKQDYQ
ncbi:hypothetical protein MHYP_G00268020 [Metynnis hypsauchen]